MILHGAVLYIVCTRVVENAVFSPPFPASLEKIWGRRDKRSLCSAFPVYKRQSHVPFGLCLCLHWCEHSLPSCVDGGGPHSWELRQPRPAWSLTSLAVSFTAIASRTSVVCFLNLLLQFSPVRCTRQTNVCDLWKGLYDMVVCNSRKQSLVN